jgi:hypothetical protein
VRSHHIFMVAITALGGALLHVLRYAPPARAGGRRAARGAKSVT